MDFFIVPQTRPISGQHLQRVKFFQENYSFKLMPFLWT